MCRFVHASVLSFWHEQNDTLIRMNKSEARALLEPLEVGSVPAPGADPAVLLQAGKVRI